MTLYDCLLQLLARLHCKPSLTCLEPTLLPDSTPPKSVYELSGEEGCGKTQLLLHLVISAILPKSWCGIPTAGLGVSVVYVDLDYHFSMIRLTTMLETRIQGVLSVHDSNQDARPSVEDLIKQCLSQLYVIRCSSSSQFLITLHSLETLLSNNPNICILMIDSISAFYWIDRSTGGSTGYSRTNNKLVVEALRELLLTYNLVVFCAKAELFEQRTYTDNGSSERGGQDMMGQHWHRLVTHRWTLGKIRPVRDHASGVLRNCYSVTGHDAQKTKSFLITEKGVEFMK